jgi:hypothetical protein
MAGIYLGLLGVSISGSAMYAYGTKFNKTITIDDKFERVSGDQNGVSQIFTVSDRDNNVYRVSRSLWYWQWYSTELWNKMKKGETYNVTGYGIRLGFLSMYPNIISIQHIDK